ncbi:hypothetical protein AHiyo1_06500 [Arthrobacter sp. Hiyo1]|nr:hypothetical protein AHiyo1_06500 [Arthrobacter sp. Hiyo1]
MLQSGEHLADVPGIMLPVGVDLDHAAVAEALRVFEAGAHGTTDAEVEGKVQDCRSGFGGNFRGGVGGAIIDDQYVVRASDAEDFAHGVAHRLGFIPRRHDDQDPR